MVKDYLNQLHEIYDGQEACMLYDSICTDYEEMLTYFENVLTEAEEYFDNIADAEYDQDGLAPNREMRLLVEVRNALGKIRQARTIEENSTVEPIQFSITGERV